MCVRLRVVKHSNTGRQRQEGTLRSAQLHGHQTGTVIRADLEDIFELLSTRLIWTFNHSSLLKSWICYEHFIAAQDTTVLNVVTLFLRKCPEHTF